MKKMLLLCGALLLVGASAALAQAPVGQVKLNFDGCAESLGLSAKTNACTSASGFQHLACSIVMSGDLAGFNSCISEVVVATDGALPVWWGTSCAGKPAMFGVNGISGNMSLGCTNDAYGGLGNGVGVNVFPAYNGANTVMAQGVVALPAGNEQVLTAGLEYFLGDLTFSMARSPVANACLGCLTPACINYKTAKIDALSLTATSVNTGGTTGAWVTWQAPASAPNSLACQGATPTRKSTWGSVKALYR